MVKEAKAEMKEYVDDKLKKTEADHKKKLTELESALGRRGAGGN